MPSDNSNNPNTALQDMMRRVAGEMENDASRRPRRGGGRRRELDKDLQNDCLMALKDSISFDDVAGNREAKKEMLEIVSTVQSPEPYRMFGTRLPKGILMTGGPGVGKTYMTQALASELNAPFYHVQVKNVTSKWFGESEQNLANIFGHAKSYCEGEIDIDLETGECFKFDPYTYQEEREAELVGEMVEEFEGEGEVERGHQNRVLLERRRRLREVREQIRVEIEAKEQGTSGNRYAIVFFDEIDALGASRDNTPFQGGVSNRIVSVLLENMDGLEACQNVIVIASTNRVSAVDPAMRRAGRFDRIIKVKKPGPNARANIFKIHMNKAEKKAEREFMDVDLNQLKDPSEKLSGADIAEIVRKTCQEQAIVWRDADEDRKEIESKVHTEHILDAIDSYSNDLRKTDPNYNDGKIGFHTENKKKSEPEVIEQDLEDDSQDTDDSDTREAIAE